MCEQLDEPGVHEDPCAERVEDTRDGRRAGRVWIVCRAYAETYADTYWSRYAIEEGGEHRRNAVFRGKL